MALTFSIGGGADAARFNINPQSGALAFNAAPDFENPSDADGNNVYEVVVAVSDGVNETRQTINVTVSDVAENQPPQITSAPSITVPENSLQVMTVTAVDPDDGGSPSVSWVNVSNGNAQVMLNGNRFEAECGANAIHRVGNAFRFTLRPGESWPDDIVNNSDGHRAELDGYPQIMSAGTVYWCSWSFQFDQPSGALPSWVFTRQYHMMCEHGIFNGDYHLGISGPSPSVAVLPFEFNRVYRFVERLVPGPSGSWRAWRDGVEVANVTGVSLLANRYPKFGIYAGLGPVQMVVRFDNFEFGTADLSSRIATPLPNTPGWLT